MKTRFRLIQRGSRGGRFYCVDKDTGRRESLATHDLAEARRLIEARNTAEQQPALNFQIARAYLLSSVPGITTRTWGEALGALIETKHGATRERWERAAKDRSLDRIRSRTLIATHSDDFLAVLKRGTVSTNVHLRKLHNFVLDMNWLPVPVLPKRQWPKIRYGAKRAITLQEHQTILAVVFQEERKAFYELCWHLGGAQSDIAGLQAEDIDWERRSISFARRKTGSMCAIRIGDEVAEVLGRLPKDGPLFPKLAGMGSHHRATEFKRACRRAGVSGVTLHSYRYAWAERARACGYPERWAQNALGHNSRAVHQAYAKNAVALCPALEEYARVSAEKVLTVGFGQTGAAAASAG